MDVIKLSVWVGEDKKLVIDLPEEVPVGLIDVQIRARAPIKAKSTKNKENGSLRQWLERREHLRRLLRNAGMLSTDHDAPTGWTPLTEEERVRLGTLPPGARPTEEYVHEDRGLY